MDGCSACSVDPFSEEALFPDNRLFDQQIIRWDLESVERQLSRVNRAKKGQRFKMDPGYDPENPEDSLDWLSEELLIAVVLASVIASRGAALMERFDALLNKDDLSEKDIYEFIIYGKRHYSNVFNDSDGKVERAIAKAMALGELRIPAGQGLLAQSIMMEKVLNGIIDVAKYSTNNYFNNFVVPAIEREVGKILAGTATFDKPNFHPIREKLDRRLKNTPYWRIVANSAAQRAFNYGYVKTAEMQQIRRYAIRAIIDERTSEVCEELDGREFFIGDAVNLMEEVSEAQDIEGVKQLMPWRSPEEVRGKSDQELTDMGVLLPPFHGNCRTTIEYL